MWVTPDGAVKVKLPEDGNSWMPFSPPGPGSPFGPTWFQATGVSRSKGAWVRIGLPATMQGAVAVATRRIPLALL
jgi:hypothetical protein